MREPLPELEVALPGGPIAPRRRDLGDAPTRDRRLDRQLQGQLEPGAALDRRHVEERPAIELEVVRRVMGRDASEPMETEARGATHQSLEGRAADLMAATHVAGRR